MGSVADLPPDQRAVLELVLRRGRTYDEIAQLLSIDRAGVRERALSALDALGPEAGVPAEQRALITDYLLGALPPRVTEQVRNRLAQSAGERAWARVIAAELEPIASRPLPEIPGAGETARPAAAPAPGPERESGQPTAEPALAAAPKREKRQSILAARRERRRTVGEEALGPGARLEPGRGRPTNRRGGIIVLASAAIIVLAIVLTLVFTGGSNNKPSAANTNPGTTLPSTTSTPSTTPGTTSTTGTSATKILSQVNLNPPSGGSAKGIGEVLQEAGKLVIAIVAQGLKANTHHDAYAVWLYNSPADSQLLGFVNPPVGSNGRLQTTGPLPSSASHFKNLIVTLETQAKPKTPGTIVLKGGPLTLS